MAVKLARVLGALVVAASLAWLMGAVSEHDAQRTRWERQREAVGRSDYDPRASDDAYEHSRRAHRAAGWSALLVAVGVCLVLVGEPGTGGKGERPTPLRRNLASSVDLLVVGAIGSLASIDDAESALLHAVAWSAPVVAIAVHALSLHRLGHTPGMMLVGVRGRAGIGAALVATIALPLAIVGLLRPSWSAPHWRLAGVAPDADAE